MEQNIQEYKPMTVADMKTQVGVIHEMLKKVMKKDVHYGTIAGCGNKPTLFKPGAEKIMMTFRLACSPETEDLSTSDCVKYRVKTNITTIQGGLFVGCGIGECSSDEEKYKWRRAVCDEEYEDTPEHMRREKYSSYQGAVKKTRQVRTNPADIANTVLKMAKKRSLIDAVLTATGASDCFSQDIEDLPDEIRSEITGDYGQPAEPEIKEPKEKKPEERPKKTAGTISDAQRKRLYAIAMQAGMTKEYFAQWLKDKYGYDKSAHITTDHYDMIVEGAMEWTQKDA